jgi:hypothetical protein
MSNTEARFALAEAPASDEGALSASAILALSPPVRPDRVADYPEWRAHDDFETYYGEVVLPDEQQVLDYQLQALASEPSKFGRALEYGCGPTLHRSIAAAGYVFRIDMADWLPDNLLAIRRWLRAGAGNADWNRFTRFILAREGRGAYAGAIERRRIERREALTRKAIRHLYLSDARHPYPLGLERVGFYDLVVSGFCLDAVSRDKAVWRDCMRNVLATLRGGGLLVLHALHRCTGYRVANRLFPGADLSVDDLFRSLLANGFVRSTIDIRFASCPENAVYGYSGILMASGRRR